VRRAREVVAGWPDGGRVVGVIADPSDPPWNGRALLKLIRVASEGRRPAFLLDLAPEASNLTARFGSAGSDGFAETVTGDATLASIAHRRPEIEGAYLPCGVTRSGEELAASGPLATLAERVRNAGGVLLVVLDRRAARRAAEKGWPDGWVLVGDADAASGGEPLPGDLPELGRIEPEEPDGSAAGRWRRHRESGSFPTLKVAGAVLLLAVLGGGWWWYAGRVTGGTAGSPGGAAGDTGGAAVVATTDSPEFRGGEESASGVGEGTDTAAPADAGDGAEAQADRGRRLEFSVLIASYASAEDARERVDRLSDQVDGLYFVAPTPVQGALWHRVYAGSLADRESARALMERLVEAGAKGEARDWDIRPVPWSFRLADDYRDRGAAEAWAEQLRQRGAPAYVLPVADGGPYRVYAGAFETRQGAAALEQQLQRAGVEAELVRRIGTAMRQG